MARERLQKLLAAAGIDSRRNCEELILSGTVTVNGEIIDSLPAFADLETDKITVNGRKLRQQQKVYYLLNKPKGYICTNSDPLGRRKAIDLIDTQSRIFCVGRLDLDSTGAIIITNDTKMADALTHPRHQITKTYVVGVKGKLETKDVERLKKGVWLAEGKTEPAKVKVLKSHFNSSLVEITISQGLNRQLRRVMASLGYKVTSLTRTSIGKLNLRGIGVGHYRALTKPEIIHLQKTSGKPVKTVKKAVAKKKVKPVQKVQKKPKVKKIKKIDTD
ncbi:MAG: rRNA pseudouridine synthase [Anaerohalosphaeraceae bacterium]|nr:rRNA pseudouridine synthase [Anaerohalosphaeraceae bacterium]